MFLRNYWYVAAYDHEIARKPLGRIILGEPVVLYRLEDGTPIALEDRCAHRHLPLSMGKLVGDTLQCHYHGLRYDKTGTCVRVPGQDMIPRSAKVKSYPVVERYHWLWIWMGDPALADPDKITDFHWFDDPNWGAQGPLPARQGQLAAHRRQPARSHASRLRARDHDRQLRAGRQCRGQGGALGRPCHRDALDHRLAGAADLREGRRLHLQRGPLADHQLHAAGVPAARRRRDADRHRRAGRQARRRHRHVEPERHHAGDREHQPLFLGPGAQLGRQESEDRRR